MERADLTHHDPDSHVLVLLLNSRGKMQIATVDVALDVHVVLLVCIMNRLA